MKDIYQILDRLNINFIKHEHPAVFTVEETDKLNLKIEGVHSKNLFLRNKKKTNYYLVTVLADKRVDLKKLTKDMDEDRLSFGTPEDLKRYLGVTPGSVSVFGLINDEEKKIIVVVDNDFFKHEKIGYHPNINTATLVIGADDFKKFLDSTGHEILYQDI